jgi:uncharacterized membrane protein YqhA
MRWVLERLRLVVADLRLPDWLAVHGLGDLKKPIIDILVVILGIKFLERSITSSALDTLYHGVGTALVIAALAAFITGSGRSRPPRSTD